MAITPAQRTNALVILLTNYGNDSVINFYIPGLTTALMVQDIVNALGTQFDAALTTCLANLVTQLQGNITATQSGITAMQAEITANTVQ